MILVTAIGGRGAFLDLRHIFSDKLKKDKKAEIKAVKESKERGRWNDPDRKFHCESNIS